ncbi:MAG: 23S rRNA (guanine(2445)-N(2))/(guanine(2069)-N(7))-methyltransferase, partial [Natronospirillum sp.]
VKDQLADYFQDRHGIRPNVSKEPDLTVVVNLHKKRATVGIELNQDSLHHRAYRGPGAKAPLRENLAAAVLMRAGWPEKISATEGTCALIDPMCGSGTLLLEGALMAADWAPGLLRAETLARRWLGHDDELWRTLVTDAEARRDAGLAALDRFEFWGNDGADSVFTQARAAWRSIGLPEARWTQSDIGRMPSATLTETGLVVVNPPYGERLNDPQGIASLYGLLGTWMSTLPAAYTAAMLLPDSASGSDTALYFDKSYRFLNADIECRLYTFHSLRPREIKVIEPAEDLANRLRKNLRKLKSFLKQGSTDAYRLYDADLPDFAIAVDRYGDWLHVQEYA